MKLAKFISYIFHPITFPIIGAFLYFLLVPSFILKQQEYLFLIVIFVGTYIFPIVLMALMKSFNMISNYHIDSIEERKFPILLFISIAYIIANWLNKSGAVDILSLLFYGYAVGLLIAYGLLYFKFKISLHTSAIAGLIGFLIYFSLYYNQNVLLLLIVLLILAGFIGTSRLKLGAHSIKEVFWGGILGLLTQFAVYFIYIM